MRSILQELWHGNVCPQTDSRNNSPEMKQLMEYMARHHDDLLKTMTDEQKEIFEKFDDCWSEYASYAEEAIFTYAFKLGAQLGDLAVVNTQEFVNTGNHGLFATFTFRAFLLNKLVDRIAFGLQTKLALHDLKANVSKISVPAL